MPKLKGSVKRAHSFSRKRKKWRKFWKKVFKKFPRTEGPLLDRKGPLSAQQNGGGDREKVTVRHLTGKPPSTGGKEMIHTFQREGTPVPFEGQEAGQHQVFQQQCRKLENSGATAFKVLQRCGRGRFSI